jgi:hypothetical protein
VYTAQGGEHFLTVKATHVLGTDTQTWHIITPSPPVADAGADQSVYVNSGVTLDGSGSTDPDNDIVSYQWQQTDGPAVTLSDPSAVKPQFSANVPGGSTLAFELVVTDSTGLKSTDTCIVTVQDITFNRTYGGKGADGSADVQQIHDGGYIMAGYSDSFGGFYDAWLVRTDSYGNILWRRTFGGGSYDYFMAVQHTNDEGFAAAGYTNSSAAGREDAWMVKTDDFGNEIWRKYYGGISDDYVYAMQQTGDGGFILAGNTNNPIIFDGRTYAWLIRTDRNGKEIWENVFTGGYSSHVFSVQQTSDGGFILAGYAYVSETFKNETLLIKTDAAGNKVWDMIYAGKKSSGIAYCVRQTADGGYIVCGQSNLGGIALFKTDANGSMAWETALGTSGNDHAHAVRQTVDGGYILAASRDSTQPYDDLLIRTDVRGNILWEKTFALANAGHANTLQLTSDGGYIMASSTNSFGAGNGDALLIKTDAEGNAPATPTP